MSKPKKFKKKTQKLKKKKDLPKLESDQEFLSAFLADSSGGEKSGIKNELNRDSRKNKHGLPFVDDYEQQFSAENNVLYEQGPGDRQAVSDDPDREDDLDMDAQEFARLLDASLKACKPPKPALKPMPLKRRLKRYPRPELSLDLHGYTAAGAEAKARSYIVTAKRQGYFTLRIIVGRGLHSEDGPVLPHVVEDLLDLLKKQDIVLSYEWEGKKRTASGAVVVFLKQFSH